MPVDKRNTTVKSVPYPVDACITRMSVAGGKYDFLPRNRWARPTGSAGWLRVPPVLNSHWFKSAAAVRCRRKMVRIRPVED